MTKIVIKSANRGRDATPTQLAYILRHGPRTLPTVIREATEVRADQDLTIVEVKVNGRWITIRIQAVN
jgi:hypothetical protein